MAKSRNLNLEILRIISMFMVVVLHFLLHGKVLETLSLELSITNFFIFLLETLSIAAVNIFVLISSYFLIDKSFKISRIIKIYAKMYIISAIIGMIFLLTNQIPFNLKNILAIFFPFLTQKYWFVNAYIMLLTLCPILNKLFETLSKKEYQVLCILLLIYNSVIPLLIKSPVTLNTGNSVIWFINLYLIAGYLKKYPIVLSKTKILLTYGVNSLLLTAIVTFFYKYKGISGAMHFYRYNSIFVLTSSVLLFLLVINIKKKYNSKKANIITFLSTSTFAVYLISDNSFIRNVLWTSWVNTLKYRETWYYGLYLILICSIIYLLCILIDKIINKILVDPVLTKEKLDNLDKKIGW